MSRPTAAFRWILALALTACCTLGGCATTTYRYGIPNRQQPAGSSEQPISITYGAEHPTLDRLEKLVQYPVKKAKEWSAEPDDKAVIPDEQQRQEAVDMAQEYLTLNQLTDVKVDVREYNPAEQWHRLRANQSIKPFWKYTVGTLNHLQYRFLPGRVIHRDSFNIFTNTLSINSTHPTNALYASAMGKYMHSKRFPGAFEAACYLPVVPLYRDYHVGSEVLTYVRVHEQWDLEKKMIPEIYGNFGGDAVSQATSIIPGFALMPFYVRPVLTISGKAVGDLTGRLATRAREAENAEETQNPAE